MTYPNICPALFLSRPNRFIAHCEIEGRPEICHVKNTGRCKELLIPGASVYVQKADNPHRSTAYDLIAVQKGSRLINMDSQIPNKVFAEWAIAGGIPGLALVKAESTYGSSRFDFYLETQTRKMYVEVKGVTLESEGIALFPDAPTERGVKHLEELCHCVQAGYDAMIVFIIQMERIRSFSPNDQTHPAFGAALRKAQNAGVRILALDCAVTPESIMAQHPIEIRL